MMIINQTTDEKIGLSLRFGTARCDWMPRCTRNDVKWRPAKQAQAKKQSRAQCVIAVDTGNFRYFYVNKRIKALRNTVSTFQKERKIFI